MGALYSSKSAEGGYEGRNLASTELHRVGQKWWRKTCQELMILGIKKYLG